jgi:hypothetical protein
MRWAGVILANWRNCWTIEPSWLDGGAKLADCGKLKEEIEDVAEAPEVAEVPGNEIDMARLQNAPHIEQRACQRAGTTKATAFQMISRTT